MKRLTSLLSALVLILLFSSSAFAQSDVTASVDVLQDLTFTKNADLYFGQLESSQSSDASIDPNGTNSNVGGTAHYGELKTTGSAGASITISFTNPDSLSDPNSNKINFSAEIDGDTTSTAGSAVNLSEGSTNTVTLDSGTGEYYIFYGGTLTGSDISAVSPATFNGNISTTISYE